MVAEEVFACKQTASQDLADGWKSTSPNCKQMGLDLIFFIVQTGATGLPCTLSCISTVQRYIFPTTYARVDGIFRVTFNYFNNLSPARMYNAYITSEITRQSKNQPFSIFFLKMADFYTAMVHQISAKCKIIAENLFRKFAKISVRIIVNSYNTMTITATERWKGFVGNGIPADRLPPALCR